MISIDDIHQKIATDFAEGTWSFIGRVLGHGALMGIAYKAAGYINYMQGPQEGFLSKINPLPLLKKLVAWAGLEVITYNFRPLAEQSWNMLKPAAKGFLSPIIKLLSTPAIRYLVEQNYLNYVLNATVPIDGSSSSAIATLTQYATYPKKLAVISLEVLGEALGNWKPGDPPPVLEAILDSLPDMNTTVTMKLLEKLERHASIAGQQVANGMNTTGHYFSKIPQAIEVSGQAVASGMNTTCHYLAKIPKAIEISAELVDIISERTGVSRPVLLAGTAAGTAVIGYLSYYGLKCMVSGLYDTISCKQETKVDNTNNVNGHNSVTLNVLVPNSMSQNATIVP